MRDLKYDFAAIEPKWQKKWQETGVYQTGNHSDKPKFYALVEFPYPSGQGLHVGHARPYTAMDVVARKRRMDGYNVLFPMGYDAFGLPTENYAIKNHIHPAKVTHDNIENFRRQLQMLGYSFDWSREVNTTDPSYYKWTQWIFLQLYKHGLAYKTTMPVNWCTSCKCVLANEEVVEGVCERCGSPVIRKEKSQWMLKITEYAQRLIDDLDGLDFIERVKTQQKNWIGRSTGAEVTFQATTGDAIVVYTTRPDTLFGATYMVLSPEHELVRKWLEPTRRPPPPSPIWSAPSSTRRRPACAWTACGASTPSTAGRSPSSSPTTCSPPTAPAPSWPYPPTTTGTGSSPRSSAARSSRWSPVVRTCSRPPSPPRTTPASWSTPTSSTARP